MATKAKRKVTPVAEGFRVIFMTLDGSLVMNRKGGRDFYFDDEPFCNRPNDEFVKSMLTREACEKGVRVISHVLNRDGLTAVVEWLK